jgi:hypothetical protein
MYGVDPMKTITVRLSESEIARIDEIAAALQEVDRGDYWGPKRGRGDVVRLALSQLEIQLRGVDALFCTTQKAGDYHAAKMTPQQRLAALAEKVKAAAAQRVTSEIPGQTSIP